MPADRSLSDAHPLHRRRAVFNVAFTIFSGMAPLIATTLIKETNVLAAPSFMMAACALLAIAASFGAPRFGGQVLNTRDG